MTKAPNPNPEAAAPHPDDAGAPDITSLLVAWKGGDDAALDELLPIVYQELRRLARYSLIGEADGHTLQTTALVHEAYLRLVTADVDWKGAKHFKAAAASAMRRVLIDHARKRRSIKRGGGGLAVSLDSLESMLPAHSRPEDLIDLDEALERLSALDERKGRAVELHYFGGLSYDEIADEMEISSATVHRDLRMARAWLKKELRDDDEG